jgi:hypothetical protein
MKLYLLSFFQLIITYAAYSQNNESPYKLEDDLKFANYLIGKEKFGEAIFFLNNLPVKQSLTEKTIDSINYLKGWSFYNLKQLDSSVFFLNKVSINSSMYYKSKFFAAYNNTFLERYDSAKQILNNLPVKDSLLMELKKFELAGLTLLEKKHSNYSDYSNTFERTYYQLVPEQQKLDELYTKAHNFKNRSIAMAGIMSAVIPGSGKLYVGKIGEGVSSFLTLAILGGITLENYNKAGPSNFKTIFFGSLFTVFYIGNIYGSMASVKIYRNEFYATNNTNILLHIHIPLRTIFN